MADSETKASGNDEKASKADEPKYDRDQLISDAQTVLGCRPHIAAGALSDLKGTGPVTVDQAKKAVDTFQKRPVE